MTSPQRLFGLALILALAAPPLHAWTPETQKSIASNAARLAPPDLYRQLVRNRDAYFLGAVDPFRQPAEVHVKNPDGSGRLDQALRKAVDDAVTSIEIHRPFNEIAYRLGVVAHYLADANNPIYAAQSDPSEGTYAADFVRYVERAEPRMRLTFYGFRADYRGRKDLPRLLEATLRRSRGFYPSVGREYRRIGYGSGVRGFDDRSTAFAVAALSLSHAVSDIADVVRAIWLEAGGADERADLPRRGVLHPLPEGDDEAPSRPTASP